jgi:hypothetical protein
MKRFFRTLRILFDRWRFTGSIRGPRPMTIAELEATLQLLQQSRKSNLNNSRS